MVAVPNRLDLVDAVELEQLVKAFVFVFVLVVVWEGGEELGGGAAKGESERRARALQHTKQLLITNH